MGEPEVIPEYHFVVFVTGITRTGEEVTAANLESVAAAEMLASYVNRNSHDTILVYDYPRTTEDVEDWQRFGKIDSYFVMLDTLDQTVLDKIQLEYDEECKRIKDENRRLKLEQRQRER